jgi:hypothetical protein
LHHKLEIIPYCSILYYLSIVAYGMYVYTAS